MGRKSTEIERDLEQQRQSLHARVERLEERVRSDAETAKNRMNERRHAVTDSVPDQLNPSQVREHPKSLLLGAFGAGLTAGLVSDRGGGGRQEPRRYDDRYEDYDRYERSRRREDEGGSFTLSLIERTLGPAMAAFQSEASHYVEDAVRDLFGGRDGSRDGEESKRNGRYSEDEAAQRATSRS